MRIIFAGTPDFAAAHLEALLSTASNDSSQPEVVAVYTQPDRKAGRGKKLQASPVKLRAIDAGIPVHQPLSLKDKNEQETLASYHADVMVVVAYGMLLPEDVLTIPRYGCINVHASLLPRWRGAAPIERAIMAGDTKTGITIMQMDVGLDTGDELLSGNCDITVNETGDSLRAKLIDLGKPLLLETLSLIANQQTQAKPQDDALANYASKLQKADAQIDWRKPAIDIERQIRALTSAINCFTSLNSDRIRISDGRAVETDEQGQAGSISVLNNYPPAGITEACLQICCGDGALIVSTLQLPGGKSMSLSSLLNGKPEFFQHGQCFDLPDLTASQQ